MRRGNNPQRLDPRVSLILAVFPQEPAAETVGRFIDAQSTLELTYDAVGATSRKLPTGYVVDHTRISLGSGEELFTAARLALENWQQLELGWLSARPRERPIEPGEVVAIVARSLGVWWMNACRIVYVIDEPTRFGFAYGTLPGHAGSGEERFLVELDDEGSVNYEILAFSRPQHPLSYLGYPHMRGVQKRFGRQSAARMIALVKSKVLNEVAAKRGRPNLAADLSVQPI